MPIMKGRGMTKVFFAIFWVLCTAILIPVGPSGAQSPQDEEAIRHIERLWDEAWNRHDPKALAALLAEDADFVNVTGTLYRGREAFENLMVRTHQTQFKDSTRNTLETHVKFLTPEIALVNARWQISGDRNADGTPRQPREGIMTRVVVKRGGQWVVVAAHNTNTITGQAGR
jgi:uncharacterized protein (TIGR02246 family)